MRGLGFDELHAQRTQRLHGGQHIGHAQADALQALVGIDHVDLGFDQLQHEAPAGVQRGGAQQRALGHDAEALFVGNQFGAEELAVELDPVVAALGADVLHDAEEVDTGGGRRVLVHRGDGHEVHVVDRKLLVAVHEIDAAAPRAVDGRDVEFHHLGVRGHRPGTAFEHVVVGSARIAHAQRHGRDRRHLAAVGGALGIGGVGIDDDVEIALAVQQHLARAVARHGAKAHHLQHLAQRLGFVGRVFDELHTIETHRVVRVAERGLQGFAARVACGQEVAHGRWPPVGGMEKAVSVAQPCDAAQGLGGGGGQVEEFQVGRYLLEQHVGADLHRAAPRLGSAQEGGHFGFHDHLTHKGLG
ncbi:hypothetical protein FQZ97_719800 [compost metagenome]